MTGYPIQATFGRGELSPRLHSRADIQHWQMGLAECFNWIVLRQGGIRRRPATRYVAMARSQAEGLQSRLVPFVFSPTQAYAIEFSHYRIRFFALGGMVMNGSVAYEIETPWPASAINDLQFAQSRDVIYIVHRDYEPRRIVRRAETNWSVETTGVEDGPYLEINTTATWLRPSWTGDIASGGYASASSETAGNPASNAFDANQGTIWQAGMIGAATLYYQFTSAKIVRGYVIQAAPFGGLATVLSAPRTWTFEGTNDSVTWTVLDSVSGEISWSYGERRYFTFDNEIAYEGYRIVVTANNDATTGMGAQATAIASMQFMGGGADAATIQFTASGGSGVNGGAGFAATDVGRHIRFLSEEAYWHWGIITSVIDSLNIGVSLRSPPLPSVKTSTAWRLGAFSQKTGFPSCVSFLFERLVFAATRANPLSIWGTKTGSLNDFGTSTPAKPDDGFSLTMANGGAIMWLEEGADLIIGMQSMTRSIGPADKNEGFSSTNFALTRPARVGSSALQPVMIGDAALFVSRSRTSIREAQFSYEAQGYTAPDIGVLSEHMFKGIRGVAFALEPDAMLWAWLDDGSLVGATYERDQQMVAFHRHRMADNGFVESACVIPGKDRDETWLVVQRRNLAGQMVRTIELMEPMCEETDPDGAYRLDSALSYSGPAVTTVSGLDHLEGKSVGVFADGASFDAVVSGGAVSLPDEAPASRIHVGLKFESRATTLRISQGGGDGSGFGRKKRVKAATVDFYLTAALKVKGAGDEQDALLRSTEDPIGEAPSLRSGFVKTRIDDRWDAGGLITMIADGAGPATVRAIIPEVESEP